uniref:Uncharacterized protein n=1 Tax=Physcomitrium patens TaxID=3218 RepID=A0A2K1K430_PHYPA|nr:hypothetical protein PHYPA_013009 [Physcomitrium patens]
MSGFDSYRTLFAHGNSLRTLRELFANPFGLALSPYSQETNGNGNGWMNVVLFHLILEPPWKDEYTWMNVVLFHLILEPPWKDENIWMNDIIAHIKKDIFLVWFHETAPMLNG